MPLSIRSCWGGLTLSLLQCTSLSLCSGNCAYFSFILVWMKVSIDWLCLMHLRLCLSSISSQQMYFWAPVLEPQLTTYHSNIKSRSRPVTELGSSTLVGTKSSGHKHRILSLVEATSKHLITKPLEPCISTHWYNHINHIGQLHWINGYQTLGCNLVFCFYIW